MQITTTYKPGKIVARGFGKQATVSYDHAVSPAANHGAAAGTLLSKHGATSRMFHPSNTLTANLDNGTGVFKFKTVI